MLILKNYFFKTYFFTFTNYFTNYKIFNFEKSISDWRRIRLNSETSKWSSWKSEKPFPCQQPWSSKVVWNPSATNTQTEFAKLWKGPGDDLGNCKFAKRNLRTWSEDEISEANQDKSFPMMKELNVVLIKLLSHFCLFTIIIYA